MLKDNIYDWIKKVNDRRSDPNFEDIMIKFVDDESCGIDYEVEDIENALEELEKEGKISKGDLCGIIYYSVWT